MNRTLRTNADGRKNAPLCRNCNKASGNWNKEFLRTTDKGVARIRQVACTRVKCDLMDSKRWGWECMLQLQGAEDRKAPADTTWAAEFLHSVGESREFLGLWINSGAIHEAKRRRATQVIMCPFPCGKWLHMIGARAKRKRRASLGLATGVGSIYSAPSPSMGRRIEFKVRQLESLLRETKIGNVLPWEDIADEAERLAISKGGRNAAKEDKMMKSWRTTKRLNEMDQTHTPSSSLDEGGLILS
jgi:hypothetical protein